MNTSNWTRWVSSILWIHILSVIGSGVVYGFITFFKPSPFNLIFENPKNAPYYIAVYIFVLIFSFSLPALGVIFKDLFGHKDLRSQLISKGFLIIGILGSLLPLILITMWDLVLNHSEGRFWIILASMCQRFGIWLTFVISILFAFIFLLICLAGKEQSQIPKRWVYFSLFVAVLMAASAISCFWISQTIFYFRIVFLLALIGYLIWAFWLLYLIPKLDRWH